MGSLPLILKNESDFNSIDLLDELVIENVLEQIEEER